MGHFLALLQLAHVLRYHPVMETLPPSHDPHPTRAYDLLTTVEREAVDEYVVIVENEARRTNTRIALALDRPIPTDIVKRSRGNLLKPIVRAALAEIITERANAQDLNPARVIGEYAALAFSNMGDYFDILNFKGIEINLGKLTPAQWAAVKTVKEVPTLHGVKYEIVLHDKMAALNKLAELMGLINSDKPPLAPAPARVKQVEEFGQDADTVYSELLEQIK